MVSNIGQRLVCDAEGGIQEILQARDRADLNLEEFAETNKRPDFVLSNQDNILQIIEIKRPHHGLADEEMVRIDKYAKLLRKFLDKPGDEEFRNVFSEFHITLVCDEIKLTGVYESAFDGLKAKGTLEHITWKTFLLRTKKMHQDFLKEAERQQRDSPKAKP